MATYNGHNEDSSGNILLSIGNGMVAKVETGTTASQGYTKGTYLFYNNRLCKASKTINSGDTFVVSNTGNLTNTNFGEELNSHLRASNGDEFYFDYKDSKPGYYPNSSKTASEFVPFGGTISVSEIAALSGKEFGKGSRTEYGENAYMPTFAVDKIKIRISYAAQATGYVYLYGVKEDGTKTQLKRYQATSTWVTTYETLNVTDYLYLETQPASSSQIIQIYDWQYIS